MQPMLTFPSGEAAKSEWKHDLNAGSLLAVSACFKARCTACYQRCQYQHCTKVYTNVSPCQVCVICTQHLPRIALCKIKLVFQRSCTRTTAKSISKICCNKRLSSLAGKFVCCAGTSSNIRLLLHGAAGGGEANLLHPCRSWQLGACWCMLPHQGQEYCPLLRRPLPCVWASPR